MSLVNRWRRPARAQTAIVFVGFSMLGALSCTSVRPPKTGVNVGAGGSSGVNASRDSGLGLDAVGTDGSRVDTAGPAGDGKIATDGARGGSNLADGPSSAGGSGGSFSDATSNAGAGSGGIASSGAGGMVIDASVDVPAPTPDALTPGLPGATCSGNGDCANSVCLDGICCDGPCSGCKACKYTITGKDNGVCAAVLSGVDPHKNCIDETATKPCGTDGTCDGAGACHHVGSNQVCGQASCSSAGVYTPVATCDGAGNCPTVKTQDCSPFQCAPTGCSGTCAVQGDCAAATSYCDTVAKTCAAKLTNGKAATDSFQCTSGIVADGVCCDKPNCTGCSACTKALNGQADGQCLNVPVNSAGHGTCTAGTGTCGETGMCDGAGKCQYPAKGTSCGSTCAGSTLTPKACDGAGACVAGTTTQNCSPYLCAADGSTCGNKKAPGQSCTSTSDCAAGSCVDNVAGTGKICCSSASACSTCQGCNSAGTACVSKNPGAPDSACGATAASCQTGTCDGAGACTKAGDGTTCGGTNMYCNQGNCGSCTPNVDCTPNPTTSCKKSLTSCATGVSQCLPSNTNRDDYSSCGAGQTCDPVAKLKTAAHQCSSGVCTAPTTLCGSIGCSGNDCATASCGDNIVETGEQCDKGSANSNSAPYCAPPLTSCAAGCSTSCQTVLGHYCGDNSTEAGYEACDQGSANGILGLCSPTCTTCAKLSGWEPWSHDDSAWAGGLYFQVTKATTLYQFKVYNNGTYRVDLYKITNASDWSTATSVWSTPSDPSSYYITGAPNPDTINLTLNLSVGTYMLVKTGYVMISSGDVPPPSFPVVSSAGITVNGSLTVNPSLDYWYQGSIITNYWSSFLDIHTCLQGVN